MRTEEILSILGRIPVAPLSYKEKDKAQPGELMMDYDDDIGHLYMKSKINGEIIDLDRNIGEISDTTAEEVKVTIDGETTNLYELLKYMKVQIGQSVKARIVDEDVVYIQKRYSYDQSSIETSLDSVQIKGFNQAPNLSVPMNIDGKIQWVAISEFIGNKPGTIPGGSNADDGLVTTVVELEPLNNKLYLLASKKQTTKYLTKNAKVFLPRTMDSYSEINWALITNTFAPKLEFPSNIQWMYNDNVQPSANNSNIYIFKTWDNGETWYGEVHKYNKRSTTDSEGNVIDLETLSKYFPSKEDLEQNYYTKEDTENRFVDNEEAQDKFATKEEMVKIVSFKDRNEVE